MNTMKIARSSHGVGYFDNKLFIIGGFDNENKMINNCEIYDIKTKLFK